MVVYTGREGYPGLTSVAKERALLIGVELKGRSNSGWTLEESLDELKLLAETAGAEVVDRMIQHRDSYNPALCIGKGKLEELKEYCPENNIDTVIFDNDLNPVQIRNISEQIDAKIIDRTDLILDIFAQRARTKEAKIQVELAQLNYILPRLSGSREDLSRLAGGIGTRGPGEQKLEYDRRKIRERIKNLKDSIREMELHRNVMRKGRKDVKIVALVGYTNAGKSTLLNSLTGADAYAEDKLFATLDPLLRRRNFGDGMTVLFLDTVGFLQKLPHHLVEAFKSTLEEIRYADAILHVIDISDGKMDSQMEVVYGILKELEVIDKPIISVFNKTDIAGNEVVSSVGRKRRDGIFISALKGQGIDRIESALKETFNGEPRNAR